MTETMKLYLQVLLGSTQDAPIKLLDVAKQLRPERFKGKHSESVPIGGICGSIGSNYGRLANKGLVQKVGQGAYCLTEAGRRALACANAKSP